MAVFLVFVSSVKKKEKTTAIPQVYKVCILSCFVISIKAAVKEESHIKEDKNKEPKSVMASQGMLRTPEGCMIKM